MELNWRVIDRWSFGEAWTGAKVVEHAAVLCEEIGPRWASSDREKKAVEYIRGQFVGMGLAGVGLEEFELNTWAHGRAEARVDDFALDLLPYNRCPACALKVPIVDAGFGTERELD